MEDEMKENERFTSGIISFKRLNNGMLELLFAEGRAPKKTTWQPTPVERDDYKSKLQELIQQIFDTALTFEHNEKAKYCEYC